VQSVAGGCGDTTDAVFAPVLASPPDLIAAFLRAEFALEGRLEKLAAERDENFLVTARDGRAFLLKITNAAEHPEVTRFHTTAFRHLAATDPDLPTPHLVATPDGALEVPFRAPGLPTRVARVLTYLPGLPLYRAPRSAAQRRHLGAVLARLDRALAGCACPLSDYELPWDLQHASRRRPLLAAIADPAARALATAILDAFERHAAPVLPTLRRQVIHNDAQPYNVLVDAADPDRVSGVIDFGDMVEAPLIDELAVACAYHVADAPAPLDFAADIVAGYHAVLPLEPAELDVLFELIAARLFLTVTITNWRAARQPENATYILRNAPGAWRALERFARLPRAQARRQLMEACRREPQP
jgi:Ser/Thr protein kinase RdoA (MazF antagonist)